MRQSPRVGRISNKQYTLAKEKLSSTLFFNKLKKYKINNETRASVNGAKKI